MTLFELHQKLIQHGVSLSVTSEGKLRYDAPNGLPPELVGAMQHHKPVLIQQLQQPCLMTKPCPEVTPALHRLPEPLVRLIHAAGGSTLDHPCKLPSGFVSNLSIYVLTSAAYYAAGIEPERQLSSLWEARAAWVS